MILVQTGRKWFDHDSDIILVCSWGWEGFHTFTPRQCFLFLLFFFSIEKPLSGVVTGRGNYTEEAGRNV